MNMTMLSTFWNKSILITINVYTKTHIHHLLFLIIKNITHTWWFGTLVQHRDVELFVKIWKQKHYGEAPRYKKEKPQCVQCTVHKNLWAWNAYQVGRLSTVDRSNTNMYHREKLIFAEKQSQRLTKIATGKMVSRKWRWNYNGMSGKALNCHHHHKCTAYRVHTVILVYVNIFTHALFIYIGRKITYVHDVQLDSWKKMVERFDDCSGVSESICMEVWNDCFGCWKQFVRDAKKKARRMFSLSFIYIYYAYM